MSNGFLYDENGFTYWVFSSKGLSYSVLGATVEACFVVFGALVVGFLLFIKNRDNTRIKVKIEKGRNKKTAIFFLSLRKLSWDLTCGGTWFSCSILMAYCRFISLKTLCQIYRSYHHSLGA